MKANENARTYRGVVIFRNTEPGRLRYTARTDAGGRAADTLAGIKTLIREAQQ